MKALVLFISLVLLALPVSALADSCSTVDLNEGADSPFRKIPIYDQDGTGLCYAYAASQMVDYYRIKKGDKGYGLTNPVYASWATYYKDRPIFKAKSLDFGQTESVVSSLKTVGTCSEEEVRQKLAFLKKDATLTDGELLFFLDTLFKFSKEERTDKFVKELRSYSPLACKYSDNLQDQLRKSGLFGIAPTLVLEKLFNGCKNHKVNVPEMDNYTVGSDARMNRPIKSSLSNKLPAQINICTGLFYQPGYRGLYGVYPPWPRNSSGNAKSDCSFHAVIVSGQTKINGECHYQIRNSWGAYWYPAGATSCACITRDGKYKAQCKRGEGAEYVGCWFKEKTIIPNVVGVNVFK